MLTTRPLPGESLLDARRRLEGLEAATSPAQQPDRGVDVSDRLGKSLGIADSPFLTAEEAARYLRFDVTAADPVHAFRRWAARWAIPIRRRGRVLLVERRVLDLALQR